MRRGILIGWLLAAAALGGCATAPETGRKQLLLTDRAEEARVGFSTFETMKRSKPISKNRAEQQRLQTVGTRIASTTNLPNAQWEFVLFEADEPNAFALPGGKVGVYTGILPITKDDAGLATVLAHEVAHAAARHGAERMSQGVMVQIGGTALSAALGGYSGLTRNLGMQAYRAGTQLGILLPYSRAHELEADSIGLIYMARAGYDPREAVAFWKRFGSYNATRRGGRLEFLSTHPLDDNRIAQLERQMPHALAEYERASNRP